MVKLFVKFMQLPAPTRVTTIVYLSCFLGYNVIGTYVDSRRCLHKHRLELQSLNKAPSVFSEGDPGWNSVKTAWDAVKYGANYNIWDRLWGSIWWPITTIANVVPAIVLIMNPPNQ